MKTAICLAWAALAAAAMTVSASAAPCRPGVRQVNGVLSRVFCGPATATVKLGGKTVKFTNGQCERKPAYVVVNIGIVTLAATSKPRPDYFGVLVGRHPGATPKTTPSASRDGVYRTGVLVTLISGGTPMLLTQTTLTLTGGRSRGTFTAKTITGAPVAGSFSC